MGRRVLLAAFAAAVSTSAVADDTVTINGEVVTVIPAPKEVVGEYLYEKKGEPKVVLNADGTGSFQPHMVAPIPIKYWALSDGSGKPVMQEGNGNHRYTIVVQYGAGGGGNYPEGEFSSFYYTTNIQEGCADVLGERFRCP